MRAAHRAALASTALALAAVGIYGVMSYVVRQRTREIGTRIALGAPRRGILWLVMRQGATIAAIGTGVGLLLGLAAGRLLRSMLFGISATDPVTLVVAVGSMALVALLAAAAPAWRASVTDPMIVLRRS